MSKTFKVIFNRARDALMVANEMTRSVQKKGMRTSIVTAVATAIGMGATAAAANQITIDADTTITDQVSTYQNDDTITLKDGVTLTVEGTTGQYGLFCTSNNAGASISFTGNGNLHLISHVGSAGIGAAFGEAMKDATVRSIHINSDGYGIYKSNGGASTFKAKDITVEAKETAVFTSSSNTPMTFEGFDTLRLSSTVGGHAVNNAGANAKITFTGGDATLTSASRGALVTMGDGAQTTFDVKSLTVDATIDNNENKGRKHSAVYVGSSTLTASAKEAIRITATMKTGRDPVGLLLEKGGAATLKAPAISITSDAVGIDIKDGPSRLKLEGATTVTAPTALQGEGNLTILGDFTANGDISAFTGSVSITGGTFQGGIENAAFFTAGSASQLSSAIAAGQNAVVAFGASRADAVAAFENLAQANSSLSWGSSGVASALYLARPINAAAAKILVNGDLASLDRGGSGITIASQGLLMLDQTGIGDGIAFGEDASLTLESGSSIGVLHATEGAIKLAASVNDQGATVMTDSPFVTGRVDADSQSVILEGSAAGGLGALASTGLQAMMRRADSVLAQTIGDRTAWAPHDDRKTNLWVNVTGERYEADRMANNASFASDMGYGSFGGDVAVTDDVTAGAAIQYGKGTVRSAVSSIKNQIDSYGVTLYGSMAFGDAKLVAEAAYVKNENDITSSQTALNQSVDTDICSAGLRGQHRFVAGSFEFIPSVGARVSRLNTDAMKVGSVRISKQEQTLVQVPIVLRVSGLTQSTGGWSVAPRFKIAYVPTFGDKEITVLGMDQTVIDTSPVQGDFGIRAQKGSLFLDASFMIGGGKEGTSSIGGRAGLRYVF